MTQAASLVLFYDGFCPLCVREMKHLAQLDKRHALELVDIQQAGFKDKYPHIDPQAASDILHAQLPNGDILLGLDVTYKAWQLVGRGFWIAPLRWPVMRWFADKAYLFFARNRYWISGLLTGQQRCEQCSIRGCDDTKR